METRPASEACSILDRGRVLAALGFALVLGGEGKLRQHLGTCVRGIGMLIALALAASCSGSAGGAGNTMPPPNPGTAPAIASFSSSPATIAPGQSSTLTWTVTGAASLNIDHGPGSVAGNSTTVTPGSTTLYTLTASNSSGVSTATTTVQVNPLTEISSFTSAKATLTAGTGTTITPEFVNATGASIDQGVGTVVSGTSYPVAPVGTTTYTLTVNGLGGPLTRDLTIATVPAASIGSFIAAPATIASGAASQLTATFTGGSGSIDHGIGPVTSGIPLSAGALTASTNYRLTVTNPAGDAVSASTTVTVGSNVGITGFAAEKSTITSGSTTKITPTFVNATSASIDQGVGSVASGLSYTVSPSTTTSYLLTAQGLGGPVTRPLTLTVIPAPGIASFTAAPPTVVVGGSSQLTANFSGGTGSIDHGIGSVTSGIPISTGALGASTTYRLTVVNAAGDSVSASTTVTVGSAVGITSFSAAKSTITAGSSTTLTPVFVNADSASIDQGVGSVAPGAGYTVTPGTTTTYTLTALGIGGPVTQSLTLTVVSAASIGSFAAVPPSIVSGGSSQLTAVFSGGSASIDHGLGAVTSGLLASVSPGSTTPYLLTVTNAAGDSVNANATVTVDYQVTFVPGLGGTLSGTMSQTIPSGGSCNAVTAIPNIGYAFSNWTGAGFATSASNPLTVTNVTQNLILTANFVPVNHTVTFVSGGNGSLTGSTSQTVVHGASCTAVTAVPNGGYALLNWIGTGGFVTTAANPLTVANVTADMTITANFATPYTVTFNVAGATGSLTGSTNQIVASGGSCSAVTAVPIAGYGFLNWTGNGGFVPTSTNPLTISNVTTNMTITANFSRLPVIGSFYATATTINAGQAAILNWSSVNFFTTASIDHGVGSIMTPNGMVGPYPAATTTYTLTATNAVGTATASVTVTVITKPVITSFTASPAAINAGQTSKLSWSVTGTGVSYSLDQGIGPVAATSFDVTPVATTTYTLTATNSAGSKTAVVTVTLGPVAPTGLTYSTNPAVYTKGVAIPANNPSSSGGAITSYGVSPALPAGLSLNPGTGVITGTPSAISSLATYTVTGTNTAGNTPATLTLTVNDVAPSIGYSSGSYAFLVGTTIANLAPSNSGGAVVTWNIAPTLPAGLSFNVSNGNISGTPTVLASNQAYTITASNSGGSSSVSPNIAVTDKAPTIAYSSSYTFFLGVPIATISPTNTGGPVVTWGIAPTLPAGLAFSTSNGQITGTPTAAAAAQSYTISASNTGGISTASPVISVVTQPPVITVQPFSQILSLGAVPNLSVTASGTGTLDYQWFRNGSAIAGATASTYAAPAFSGADDGAVFTVTINDTHGGSTTSSPAMLSLFQDLTTWLNAHPTIAGAIKWQFQAASGPQGAYQPPAETDKKTWANWSASQKSDLNQAYLDLVTWINQGAPQVTMTAGTAGQTTLTDRPWNTHSSANDPTSTTMETVEPAYMWKLYIAHVAFSLMLETSHQVPWSVTDYPDATLKWIFDSATMGWYLPYSPQMFSLGTYDNGGAGRPALRTNNRPRTTFADPRWTYPWLKQAGIIGSTRLATIGRTLDWMRQNMTHFFGSENIGTDLAIWQYNGYSPISRIVNGTIDSNNPSYGVLHWTAGCHGSTGFLNAALRVVNIPVQPIWVCSHELVYFMSEDKYMDHADDPYNSIVRASGSSSLLLLIDSATWRVRFGADETINIWGDTSAPAFPWIGYTAGHFPP